ncbi:MAG: DUF3025 domain-containing protein [Gammaproteobacteria bacterium]|nr:DUF3025 domain-containing protein [Gammaproteobacteria bacterium]
MRFQSPARDTLPAARLNHPIFAPFAAYRPLLEGPQWPALEALSHYWASPLHRFSALPLRFVAQTPALTADGLHYEERIYTRGEIATRLENWHDLFNALMWFERLDLKCAVNAAYIQEFAAPAEGARTRRQAALTHFDEGGAIVVLRTGASLPLWDSHDWTALFSPACWADCHSIVVFGHALLEQCLMPNALPVAKCLVALLESGQDAGEVVSAMAQEIAEGRLLRDPKDLRPLPLVGMPGWHDAGNDPAFFANTPCFRPLRAGRCYPPPWPQPRGEDSEFPLAGGLRLAVAAR